MSFMLVHMMAISVQAGENQARRIEELEAENYRLSMEVSRLREQVRQLQPRRSGYSAPYGYSYGRNPTQGAAQQLRGLNQMKREWEQLTR